MSVTGEPDGPPTKVGVALLDLIAGLECAVGALAALVGAARRSCVEVNLVEAGVTSLINVLGNHLATGDEPRAARQRPSEHRAVSVVRGSPTATSSSRSATTRSSAGLLGVLGLDGRDGRFATNPMRIGRSLSVSLRGSASAIATWDRAASSLGALAAADVPAGPVNAVPEALAAMGDRWVQEIDGIRLAPNPLRIDGERDTAAARRRRASASTPRSCCVAELSAR